VVLGVELFRSKYLAVDPSVRASGLIGKESDLGIVTGAGVTIAF